MDFVSWDYGIPNIWKVIKFMFQTNDQILLLITSLGMIPIFLSQQLIIFITVVSYC